jgi:hypothetical protein
MPPDPTSALVEPLTRALMGVDALYQSPSRAALIGSYGWGERVVAPLWRGVNAEHRADFLRFLYGRMHSNESVAMFDPEKSEA